MIFTIRQSDPLPIYRQIERQVIDAVLQGRLSPGDKLPSHRDLAQQLVVAPLTVKKAYDTLEAQEVIETKRGLGTFIRNPLPRVSAGERRHRLKEMAERLLLEAGGAGVSWQDLLEILEESERQLDTHLRRE